MQFFEIILSRKEAKLLKAAENAPVVCSVRNIEQISRMEALGFIQSDFVCQVSGENLSARKISSALRTPAAVILHTAKLGAGSSSGSGSVTV